MATRTLPASIKIRIWKPFQCEWSEISPQLHGLSWVAHRVLNGAMARMALSHMVPDQIPDDWCSKKNENSEKRAGGKASAYQMIKRAIDDVNAERVKAKTCVWCNGAKVEPQSAPVNKKGKAFPKTKAQSKVERKPGDPCSRCDGVGQTFTGDAIDVPIPIQSGWARFIEKRFGTDRSEIDHGAKSLSTFRNPAPVCITSSGTHFKVERIDRNYVLTFPLFAGGSEGHRSVVLAPDGGNAHAHLQKLVSDPSVKLGDLKIIAPKGDRKDKWMAVISYSWDQQLLDERTGPEAWIKQHGDGSPELHIEGRKPKRLYEGLTMIQKRKVYSLRRAGRSRHQRDIGDGARGHGKVRMREHYHAVDDAEQRWVKSLCQEIAAKAVKEALLRGSKWIWIDDGVKVLPPAALRSALEWALNKNGFVEPADKPKKEVKEPPKPKKSLSGRKSNQPASEGSP